MRTAVVLLAILLPLSAARSQPAESSRLTTDALRVMTAHRFVRLALPRSAGTLVAAPATTLVLTALPPPDPVRVQLEDGVFFLSVPAVRWGEAARVEGALGRISVPHGSLLYWRSAATATEGGLQSSGQGALSASGGGSPLTTSQSFSLDDKGAVAWHPVQADDPLKRVADLAAQSHHDELVDLPGTVPPSTTRPPPQTPGGPVVIPLAASAGSAAIPETVSGLVSVELAAQPERLIVSLAGEGLAGAGFYVDGFRTGADRAVTRLWTGGRAFVRFLLPPDWLVTLAPNTIATVEGPIAPEALSRRSLDLTAGAALLESRAEATVTTGPLETGPMVRTGQIRELAGQRTFVVARISHNETAQSSLARARDILAPVLTQPLRQRLPGGGLVGEIVSSLGRSAPTSSQDATPSTSQPRETVYLTIPQALPVDAELLSRFLAVQVRSSRTESRIEVVGMGAPASAESPVGFLAELPRGAESAVPAALVLPRRIPAPTGDHKFVLTLFLSQLDEEPRAMAESARRAANKIVPLEVSRSPFYTAWILLMASLLGIGPWLLLRRAAPRLWVAILTFIERFIGVVRRRCSSCGLVFQKVLLGEFRLDEKPTVLVELTHFDEITEAAVQKRTRKLIIDSIGQLALSSSGEGARYRVTIHHCRRCLAGEFVTEVVADDRALDEGLVPFRGADTHQLVEDLARLVAERRERSGRSGGAS